MTINEIQAPVLPENIKVIYCSNLDPVKNWAGTEETLRGSMLAVINLSANKYIKGQVEIQQGGKHLKITDTGVIPVWLANNQATHKEEIIFTGSMKWKYPESQFFAYGATSYE